MKTTNLDITSTELFALLKKASNSIGVEKIISSYANAQSGELLDAKILSERLKHYDDALKPSGIRDLISQASDCNVLTDALLELINSNKQKYLGVMVDVLQRDEIDKTKLEGGEAIILLENENLNKSLQYFDKVSSTWVDYDPLSANAKSVFVSDLSSRTILNYKSRGSTMFTVSVLCKKDTVFQTSIITICKVGVSSTDIMVNSNLVTGNAANLVNFTATMSGDVLDLRANTNTEGVTIKATLLSEL